MTKAELIAALASIPDTAQCYGYLEQKMEAYILESVLPIHDRIRMPYPGVSPEDATLCFLVLREIPA